MSKNFNRRRLKNFNQAKIQVDRNFDEKFNNSNIEELRSKQVDRNFDEKFSNSNIEARRQQQR